MSRCWRPHDDADNILPVIARTAHPRLFALGVTCVVVGALLHLPMYFRSAHMGYRMAGMEMSAEMIVGMGLILGGLVLTAVGLRPAAHETSAAPMRIESLDNAPLRPAHIGLMAILALAVTIDVMKPVTLGFIAPGVAAEYGLRSAANPDASVPVALLPLSGILGTVVGSLIGGALGDRLGRRSTIVLASVMFIGTSVCGTMPSFAWNVAMCLSMGLAVGGMLPLTFTLIAETVPSAHRGWLMVLLGGDVAGGYILTSWLSESLTPDYGWRVLWLIGIPTGLLLLVLNRWIPESPRFLVAHGRTEEAREVLSRFGARLVPAHPVEDVQRGLGSYRAVLARRFRTPTTMLILLATGVGLVTFGFQLWIPTNLRVLGFSGVTSDGILRDSALLGLPLTVLVAALYGLWSTRGTLILLAGATVAALVGFAVLGDDVVAHETVLRVLLIFPTVGVSSVLAVTLAYATEIYPTSIRSRGVGLASAASKAGGLLVIGLVAAAVTAPSIRITAVIAAVPLAAASVSAVLTATETRRRTLEQLAEEPAVTAVG